MPKIGDEGLILGDVSLAAATSDEYYFPLGYQSGVGVANVEGRYRTATLKELHLKGTDSNVMLQGLYLLERDNHTIKWILGPIAAANAGIRYHANDNGPAWVIRLDTLVKDCRSIVLRVRNGDGSNAKSHSAMLIYRPEW